MSHFNELFFVRYRDDAITSDRVYQKGRTHLEAITIMTKNSGTHLDADLAIKFIECLGIYPPGNLVEMSNGEVAVVVETDLQHKLKPSVMTTNLSRDTRYDGSASFACGQAKPALLICPALNR